MAVYKFTALFSQPTNVSSPTAIQHRVGGWSESWYGTFNSVQDLLNNLSAGLYIPGIGINAPFLGAGFLGARATLLGIGAAIVGLRVQQVSPIGPSQSVAVSYPGSTFNKCDTPQQALLCKSPSLTTSNIRRFTLRGIPDNQITEGEFSPDAAYFTVLNTFFGSLKGLQFQARDFSQPTFKIISVDATGIVTCTGVPNLPVNTMVRVLRSKDSGGNLRGILTQVKTIGPGPTQVTLLSWPWGATTLGTIRQDAKTFVTVDSANTNFTRIIVKKVGRPPGQYRGRRSKRR